MSFYTSNIVPKLKAAATLLFLLLCVCGAVAREKNRAIALPFEDSVYNFRMLYEYDSWNRVQRIVYPDSEVVSYSYDLGGQLYSVSTFKNNVSSSLINSILYDEFGHRTQVNFGNGVTTNYTYDILQRLSTLQTYSKNANLQKIMYSFDYEDNITKVINTAGGANGLGWAYVNTYNYDDLYRLTAANGSYSRNNTNYSLEMSYTPAGRLCGKLQDYTGTGNIYAYSPNAKPHAVRRYYNGLTNELYNLLWDANGNLAQQMVYSVANNATTYQGMRYLQWDEDDRLNLVAGDGYLSYYAYGYDGNRAIKMTGNAAIDQTGMLLNSTNLENITIYPNEYLTVTQAEYTKYYYAGGNRIASKIGTGGFEKMTRLCTEDLFFSGNANTLFGSVILQVTNTANQPNDEYPVNVCGGYNVATELLTNPLPDFYISQTNLNFTQNNLLQQFRQNLTNAVEPVYYFHSDHLGSASWITSGTGLPVQHLLYLPFGEHFANEQRSGYFERFTFTGKERDLETGYYYHGARFNSSDIGWLSVDPMADKYPSLTPYNYCAWNPVKLVDPDGEEAGDPPKSRITVQKGYVVLKMDNLHNSTRNKINAFNNDTKNWPEGYIGAIGPLAHIEYKTPELLDPQGGYGYSQPSDHYVRTKAVTAKSTGLPDKRVTPRAIPSGGSKGMNIALVAIDATIFTLNAIAYCFWNNDMKNVRNQISMLGSAFEDVKMYDIEIGLPANYRTPEQMLYIANYVLQKENVTKDPMVKQIGDVIRARNNYKYNNQIQQCTGE